MQDAANQASAFAIDSKAPGTNITDGVQGCPQYHLHPLPHCQEPVVPEQDSDQSAPDASRERGAARGAKVTWRPIGGGAAPAL